MVTSPFLSRCVALLGVIFLVLGLVVFLVCDENNSDSLSRALGSTDWAKSGPSVRVQSPELGAEYSSSRNELSLPSDERLGSDTEGLMWRLRPVGMSGRLESSAVALALGPQHEARLMEKRNRAFLNSHEGEVRMIMEKFGDRYTSDESGVIQVPWRGSSLDVYLSTEKLWGSVHLKRAPLPNEEIEVKLRLSQSTRLTVLDHAGEVRQGIPVDVLWEHDSEFVRTPLGRSDARGGVALEDSVRIMQYAKNNTPTHSVAFIAGVPGCFRGPRLDLFEDWPRQLEINLPKLGVLDIELDGSAALRRSMHASLLIRPVGVSISEALNYPLKHGGIRGLQVSTGRDYVIEISGSNRVPYKTTVVGPAGEGDRVCVKWFPTGYLVVRARLLDSATGLPCKHAHAMVRFEAPKAGGWRFPINERVDCDADGRLECGRDIGDLRSTETVSIRMMDGTVYPSLPFRPDTNDLLDLGTLYPLSAGKVADVLVVDEDGDSISGAHISAAQRKGCVTTVTRNGDRFTIRNIGNRAGVSLIISAKNYVSQNIDLKINSSEVVVTMLRAGKIRLVAKVDNWVDLSVFRPTLTRSDRRGGSAWGQLELTTGTAVVGNMTWVWRGLEPGNYDLWVMSLVPPVPIRHKSVEVTRASESIELDLRGVVRAVACSVQLPTTPVCVVNTDANGPLYLNGALLPSSGGNIFVPGGVSIAFMRSGSCVVGPKAIFGDSVNLEFYDLVDTIAISKNRANLPENLALKIEAQPGSLGADTPCIIWTPRAIDRKITQLGKVLGVSAIQSAEHVRWPFSGNYRLRLSLPSGLRSKFKADLGVYGIHGNVIIPDVIVELR